MRHLNDEFGTYIVESVEITSQWAVLTPLILFNGIESGRLAVEFHVLTGC